MTVFRGRHNVPRISSSIHVSSSPAFPGVHPLFQEPTRSHSVSTLRSLNTYPFRAELSSALLSCILLMFHQALMMSHLAIHQTRVALTSEPDVMYSPLGKSDTKSVPLKRPQEDLDSARENLQEIDGLFLLLLISMLI